MRQGASCDFRLFQISPSNVVVCSLKRHIADHATSRAACRMASCLGLFDSPVPCVRVVCNRLLVGTKDFFSYNFRNYTVSITSSHYLLTKHLTQCLPSPPVSSSASPPSIWRMRGFRPSRCTKSVTSPTAPNQQFRRPLLRSSQRITFNNPSVTCLEDSSPQALNLLPRMKLWMPWTKRTRSSSMFVPWMKSTPMARSRPSSSGSNQTALPCPALIWQRKLKKISLTKMVGLSK